MDYPIKPDSPAEIQIVEYVLSSLPQTSENKRGAMETPLLCAGTTIVASHLLFSRRNPPFQWTLFI